MYYALGLDPTCKRNAKIFEQWQTFTLTSDQESNEKESDEKETIDEQFAHSVPSMIRAKSMSNLALGAVPSMKRSCSAPSLSDSSDDEDDDCTGSSCIFSAGYDSDDSSDDEDNYF